MEAATPAPSVGSMRCATPHQVACKSVTWQHIRLRGTSVVERATHPPQHPESSSSPLNEGYLDTQRRDWLSTMRRRRGCHARRLCVDVNWLPCCSIRSVCPDVRSDLWLQHCAILVLDDALCLLQATACHFETLKASDGFPSCTATDSALLCKLAHRLLGTRKLCITFAPGPLLAPQKR